MSKNQSRGLRVTTKQYLGIGVWKFYPCTVENDRHLGWQTIMITVLVLPRFFLQPAIRVSSFHSNPINFWLQMQAEQFGPRLGNMKSMFVDLEKFEISPYHSESLYLIFTIKIKTKILKEKKILAEDKPHFIENSFLFLLYFSKIQKISGLLLD